MIPTDYTDNWRRYWASSYEGGRRPQLENAANDPLGGWLTADVPTLVEDDVGIDPEHLRDHPDLVLGYGRDGFREFVDDHDVVDGTTEREAYETLPIHLAGLGRIRELDFVFEDPVTQANSLRVFTNVEVTDGPTRRLQPSVVSFRCPAGHETRLIQPLFRRWTVETCGESECSNEVVLVDADTRVRRITRFTVRHGGTTFPCTATGRYAGRTVDANAVAEATRLHVTGVPRLVLEPHDDVQQHIEISHAEPA